MIFFKQFVFPIYVIDFEDYFFNFKEKAHRQSQQKIHDYISSQSRKKYLCISIHSLFDKTYQAY